MLRSAESTDAGLLDLSPRSEGSVPKCADFLMWRGSDYLSRCTQNRTCCKSCSLSVVCPGGNLPARHGTSRSSQRRQEKFQGREIMNTQDAIFNGDQNMSDNGQEQTLQDEVSGTRINALGTGESTSPAQIPHHGSCCCMSCWPKNMNAYL